jgi:ribosomal protein L7/L12
MRSRAERNRDFEAVKSNLFEAGVSVVKAAKAHEEMFNTSLEAIADAMELDIGETPLLGQVVDGSEANLIYEALLLERQAAETKGDFDAYVSAEEKLQQLEEFEARRLERQARMLEAQVRIQAAQKLLDREEPPQKPEPRQIWTESTLKAKYNTLKKVRDALGVAAKSWKDAVEEANQQGV